MFHINFKKIEMRSNYTMLEATNRTEAQISLLDVLTQRPLWINKCTSKLFVILLSLKKEESIIEVFSYLTEEMVTDLFVEAKTQYYNYKDITKWNY